MKLLVYSLSSALLLGLSACGNSYSLYLLSRNVGGIYESSDVVTNGLTIGEVGHMSIYDKDHILVQLKIDKQHQIPRNSIFTFVASDLLGSRVVQITLAPDSASFYRNNDTVYEAMRF